MARPARLKSLSVMTAAPCREQLPTLTAIPRTARSYCNAVPVLLSRSQADGKITMPNVPAGPCKAWAFDDGDNIEYADEDWMRRYAGAGVDVTIVTGSAVQVSLVR